MRGFTPQVVLGWGTHIRSSLIPTEDTVWVALCQLFDAEWLSKDMAQSEPQKLLGLVNLLQVMLWKLVIEAMGG